MHWGTVETIISSIILGTGALWTFWTKFLKPFLKKRQKDSTKTMIKNIWAELNFNGGSTLKDAVFSIKDFNQKVWERLDSIEENQKVAMNVQGVAYFQSDSDGEWNHVSRTLCRLLNRNESELLESNWTSWIHPDDKERVFKAWIFSIDNHSPFEEEFPYRKPDDTWQGVSILAFPKVIAGKFGGMFGKVQSTGVITFKDRH